MFTRAVADAAMDRQLAEYVRRAEESGDAAAIIDADRAQRIRANPKFLALVDVIAGLSLRELRGSHPERVHAVAELLDTAAINLEPNTTTRGARKAAKVAITAILDDLRVRSGDRLVVIEQILLMARDWSRERVKRSALARIYATAPRGVPAPAPAE